MVNEVLRLLDETFISNLEPQSDHSIEPVWCSFMHFTVFLRATRDPDRVGDARLMSTSSYTRRTGPLLTNYTSHEDDLPAPLLGLDLDLKPILLVSLAPRETFCTAEAVLVYMGSTTG